MRSHQACAARAQCCRARGAGSSGSDAQPVGRGWSTCTREARARTYRSAKPQGGKNEAFTAPSTCPSAYSAAVRTSMIRGAVASCLHRGARVLVFSTTSCVLARKHAPARTHRTIQMPRSLICTSTYLSPAASAQTRCESCSSSGAVSSGTAQRGLLCVSATASGRQQAPCSSLHLCRTSRARTYGHQRRACSGRAARGARTGS